MRTGFLFVVLAFVHCALHARTGEAEVREGPRGGPCFSISQREGRLGTPEFQAVTVSDGRRTLWHMGMPPGRASFALDVSICVPYGARTAALPQTPAAALEPGRPYLLRIDARPGRSGRAATSYEARFCLVRQPDGNVAVRPLTEARRDGEQPPACPSSN